VPRSPPTLAWSVTAVCTWCFETTVTVHGPHKSGGFSFWYKNIVGIFLADNFFFNRVLRDICDKEERHFSWVTAVLSDFLT
jgi:hypothetical protein